MICVKNKYKITVGFVQGGFKDFFVDDYTIDDHDMVSFRFKGKLKKFHTSNVEIETSEEQDG